MDREFGGKREKVSGRQERWIGKKEEKEGRRIYRREGFWVKHAYME